MTSCSVRSRNAGLALSLPVDGAPRHCRSRFLSNGTAGFWVEAPADERPVIDELIRSAQPVGVSVTSGRHKVLFATPLERRDSQRVNVTTRLPALLMGFPRETTTIQRRTRQVARVPAGADVRVRGWQVTRAGRHRLEAGAMFELRVRVGDNARRLRSA